MSAGGFCFLPWTPVAHLSVVDEGRRGGQAGLDALVPWQHVLLVVVQELVQDPAETEHIVITTFTGVRGHRGPRAGGGLYLRMESWMARSARCCSIRRTRSWYVSRLWVT